MQQKRMLHGVDLNLKDYIMDSDIYLSTRLQISKESAELTCLAEIIGGMILVRV